MKRHVLPILLACGFLSMGMFAAAQPAPLPDDPRFDAPVTLQTGFVGVSLREAVLALAASVGLTAIVDDIPADAVIAYNIPEGRPFRQVWNLVLSLNNLEYELLENDLVIVGDPSALARFRGATLFEQRIYNLSNARAADFEVTRRGALTEEQIVIPGVATVLRQSFGLPAGDQTTGTEPTGPQQAQAPQETAAPQDQAVQAPFINITADVRTNSIIVTAPTEIQEQIARLLPQLDRVEPQVNIQVRIQEIQTSAAQNLGINLSGGLGTFTANVLDGGLNFIFDPQRVLTGLNIGAVLDTLEAQGLSRRVDDSNLTTLNNSSARFNSGGRIEITLVGIDGTANERTIEFGVIIDITPRIAADGRVILDVRAEVSDIATPLGTGVPERIDFTTREVFSTVSLEPGQTVVLGGLLQNSFSSSVNRVPVLGNLPLVGELFSTRTLEENNAELLLVINAVIIE